MAQKPVTLLYITGVFGQAFEGATATLEGSWDSSGLYSDNWSVTEMTRMTNDDGGVAFRGTVSLDTSQLGATFKWGVRFHFPDGRTQWAIATEIPDPRSKESYRTFRFGGTAQEERYYLTHCRRLGANKYLRDDNTWSVRFAVWAPNALNVELVFGSIWDLDDPKQTPVMPNVSLEKTKIAGGYIANDGFGIHPKFSPIPMTRTSDGVWETSPDHPSLKGDLTVLNHRPYMFRVTQEDGFVAYRTDLYSRCQIGFGANDPGGAHFTGWLGELAGTCSCSVTVDPEQVTGEFEEPVWPEKAFIDETEFWATEFTSAHVPTNINDLIIYELHTGALGYPSQTPGTIKDALALLDHIQDAGFTAVELLPLSEFGGGAQNWGYATSHYFAIEYGGGGRDQFKFFIRECHRRGLAVIMDVVYNHFAHSAERAEFNYDSTRPENNIYYWYEGMPFDYVKTDGTAFPEGGYLDNLSTAWAPRFHEEMVRKMFISSAVMLLREFHVDGFRVDQTTSIHSYNVLHADGRAIGTANMFGAKFLRELGRTLRMFHPGVFLMAEDHSTWDEVTMPVEQGGMGFDARWYSMFYHHLSGDTNQGGTAKLLYSAAQQMGSGPLLMSWFAGALADSGNHKVVYSESHDEAGNSDGPFYDANRTPNGKEYTSHRGIVVASNAAPLTGETLRYAEARCRFAWGVTVLSAGIPMTLFGEEVGARRRFKYDSVIENKEDFAALASGEGRRLSRFYKDINAIRQTYPALRSTNIDIVHCNDDNRVIAFRRWDANESLLVVASLADQPYSNGYWIANERIESGYWRIVFTSDATEYGGHGVGIGERVESGDHALKVVIPMAGFVVLLRS